MIFDDKNYFAFILGYDLLSYEFKESPNPECDLTFKFCNKIADDYLNSEYAKDTNHSSYEMLEKYVNDNRFNILKKYENFIGVENLYFKGNKKLFEVGMRNNEPVALLKWSKGINPEFVIAIDYTIDNDTIYWSRGYYYKNLGDAKIDFKRVKNGEYLCNIYKERDDR